MKTRLVKIVMLFATVYSIASCAQNDHKNSVQGESKLLSFSEFNEKLNSTTEKQILDVRTPEEFQLGHLSNAQNINIYDNDFDLRIGQLDKNKPVFVYCKGGGRSEDAAERMKDMGFTVIYDLKGGILSWTNNNMPTETDGAAQVDAFKRSDYDALLSQHKLILIDYYAPWCGPCKRMEPVLEKLTKEYADKVTIYRINIDEAQALANEMQIDNIPVFTSIKNAQEVSRASGYQSEDQIRTMLESLLK